MNNELQIYETEDQRIEVRLDIEQETLWLSQAQMADLFGKDSDTISLHLKNIYNEGELEEMSTTEEFSVVRTEGNLQTANAVGDYD